MRARLSCVHVPIFVNYIARVSALRKRQPSRIYSMRQPNNTMKNTSLSVPLGNAKGTPSVEPAERKRARFRAPGGTQVIGLKALIAQRSRKRTIFFHSGKSRRLFSEREKMFVFTFSMVEHSSKAAREAR